MQFGLSAEQIGQYNEHGYIAPITVLSESDAAECLSELDDAMQRWPGLLDNAGRNNAHYVLPVLDKLSHNGRILDAVESILGHNILVAGTTLFIKEPENSGFISWHQDARYIGLEPHNWVTAWLALTDVNENNGCMRMVPGSHKQPLLDHIDTYEQDNMLTRGQTVPDVDEAQTDPVILRPGQLSLHHPRVVHGSGANLSSERRVGFAIQSYIGDNVDQVIGKIYVQQARGEDRHRFHQHKARVKAPMRSTDIAFWQQANDQLSTIFYTGAKKKGKY